MAYRRVHKSRYQNPQSSWNTTQATAPSVQEVQRSSSPKETENQAFGQHKFEAVGLQLKHKHGTITPVEQARLGVLQAKMDHFWVERKEKEKPQPNLLEILSRSAHVQNAHLQKQEQPSHQAQCGCPVCTSGNIKVQAKSMDVALSTPPTEQASFPIQSFSQVKSKFIQNPNQHEETIQSKSIAQSQFKQPIQRQPVSRSITVRKGGSVVQRGFWSSIKKIGSAIGGAISDGVKKFGGAFAGLAKQFGKGFIDMANKFGKGFVDMATKFGKGFVDLASKFGQTFVNLASRFGKGFVDLVSKYGKGFIDLASKFGQSFVSLAGKFGKMFVDLASKFGKSFIDLASKFGQSLISIVQKFGSLVIGLAQKFGKVFIDLATKFGKLFVDLAAKFGSAFISLAQKLGQAFINLVSTFGKIVIDLAAKYGKLFIDLLVKIGQRMIDLVLKYGKIILDFVVKLGIKLWDKVSGIFSRFIGWIKQLPARVGRLLLHVWEGVKSLKPWSLSWWQSLGNSSTWLGLLKWLGTVVIDLVEIVGLGEIYETLMDFVKFNTRTLTGGEIAKAQPIFGSSINYGLVRVDEMALLGPSWTDRPYTSFHTINSWGSMDDHTLIHELSHVWQYEHAGAIYMPQAIHAQNSKEGYDYGGVKGLETRKAAGQDFSSFNREQQAQLIADYFAIKSGGASDPSNEAGIAKREVTDPVTGEKTLKYDPNDFTQYFALYEHFARAVKS